MKLISMWKLKPSKNSQSILPTFPSLLHVHCNRIVLLLLVFACVCSVTALEAFPPAQCCKTFQLIKKSFVWVGGGGPVFSDYFCLTRCSKIDIFLPVLHECSHSFAFLSQVWWVNTSQRLKFSFQSLSTWPKAPQWSWNASLWGSKFTPTKCQICSPHQQLTVIFNN